MASQTSPGTPQDYQREINELTNNTTTTSQQSLSSSSSPRLCKKCHSSKPERCHHCSICNRCIMRMDHHCPWLNNCVGLNNYRFFLSFLFFVVIGTLLLVYLTTPRALDMSYYDVGNEIKMSFDRVFQFFTNPKQIYYFCKEVGESVSLGIQTIFAPIFQLFSSTTSTTTSTTVITTETLSGAVGVESTTTTAATTNVVRRKLTYYIRKLLTQQELHNYQTSSILWTYFPTLAIIAMDFELQFFLIFVISFGVCMGVLTLFSFHLYLVQQGCTTIELFAISSAVSAASRSNNNNNASYIANMKAINDRKGFWKNLCKVIIIIIIILINHDYYYILYYYLYLYIIYYIVYIDLWYKVINHDVITSYPC
jgi:hypothetical protein